MVILVGHEESQRVTLALRELGHEAYSCDLQECSGGHPEFHLKMDVFDAIALRDDWDAGLFFPDCTYLTCSAEWAYKNPPYHQKVKPGTLTGKKRREARKLAVQHVRKLWDCGIQRISIENPVGKLSTLFRKPSQIIQPYQFGEDASKRTCLWLKNLPLLQPTKYVEGRLVCCGMKLDESLGEYGCPNCEGERTARRVWSNQTNSGQNKLPPGEDRAKLRSKTYKGIAEAMANQWFGVNKSIYKK